MKKEIVLTIIVHFFLFACGQNNTGHVNSNIRYKQFRNHFDKKLVSHFPEDIDSDTSNVILNTNTFKNNVGLLLIEEGINIEHIDSTILRLKSDILGEYNSEDTCLLILNRFETKYTYENIEIPEGIDSLAIDKDCYEGKFPIPNFIECNYIDQDKQGFVYLDSTFVIDVIESRPNKFLIII